MVLDTRSPTKSDSAFRITNDRNSWCDEHGDAANIIALTQRVNTGALETRYSRLTATMGAVRCGRTGQRGVV